MKKFFVLLAPLLFSLLTCTLFDPQYSKRNTGLLALIALAAITLVLLLVVGVVETIKDLKRESKRE